MQCVSWSPSFRSIYSATRMPRIYKLQIVNNFAVKNNKPSRLGDKFDANEGF